MTVLDNFDPSKEAFLNPGDFTKPVPDFLKHASLYFPKFSWRSLFRGKCLGNRQPLFGK